MKVTHDGSPDVVRMIHVIPDKRGIMPVEARENLGQIIKGLQDNTIVALPPGATFDLAQGVEIKGSNIEFCPAGPGDPPRIRRITGNGSSSLIVHGLDFRRLSRN